MSMHFSSLPFGVEPSHPIKPLEGKKKKVYINMYAYNDNNDDYIGAELIIKNTVIACCKSRAACLITATFKN